MKQIVLDNDVLRISICPAFGGKITSFYLKTRDFELAAQCSKEQHDMNDGVRKKIDSFAPYAYGMDDAFPNINSENVDWNQKQFFYPDHGEIWKASFEVMHQSVNRVDLSWRSSLFCYLFQKSLWLEGSTLYIRYHIKYEGEDDFPCIWTWHGLITYEQDMELLLPEDLTHFRNVLDGGFLGKEGKVYPRRNDVFDFHRMPDPGVCNQVKYYGEESTHIGHCGVYYPSRDIIYCLDYDAAKLPYLGVWVTAGGFQGDYNCALEPANGYYDSIGKANKNNKLPILKYGESLDFTIGLTLQEGKGCQSSRK